MTKEELPSAKLRPKQALKERIRKYLKRHPERRPQWREQAPAWAA